MSKLFSPTKTGAIALDHRVVMAPLTRLRSDPDDTPSAMMVEHYGQRASQGGLIIVEAASVSLCSRAYYGAPGLYADRHIKGYRHIADAVHTKGGKVMAQIIHNGRTSHVEVSGGAQPIGPSVVPLDQQALTPTGWKPVSPHRAMDLDDIKQTIHLGSPETA